jgi:hypothetical protein
MRLPRARPLTARDLWRVALSAATLAVISPASRGDEATPDADKKEAKEGKGKWVPLFQKHSDEYVVTVAPGSGTKWEAKRTAEPVLRWWQPVRGGDDGALYLWVREGRPVAALTFFTFKWPDGNRAIVHERHSLSREPLEASWRGQTVWRTSKPGVVFSPVSDAPPPAETPAARLRQMQAILRDVSASTRDDKGSNWPLRPLTKPLYRYEAGSDGAVFALAQGTDPEAFVLLEVEGEGKAARWACAVARFTDLKVSVRHKGREIFEGPNTTGQPDGIYHSTTVLQKPSDAPEDFQ